MPKSTEDRKRVYRQKTLVNSSDVGSIEGLLRILENFKEEMKSGEKEFCGLDFDTEGYYNDENILVATYTEPETEEEYKERLRKERSRKRVKECEERQEYRRLKKKFDKSDD